MEEHHPSQPNQELPRRVLLAPHPTKKCTTEDWAKIRSLIEAGATAPDVAKTYGLAPATINTKSHKESWASPRRVAIAIKNNDQNTEDPAALVAQLWAKRKEDARESLYQGTNKALQRFFAMSPVPQTFAEAAAADKLLAKSIDPNSDSNNQSNVSIQLLATHGFQPKPCFDV